MMTLLTKNLIIGKNLVTFTASHKSIASNSLVLADALDRQHSDVTRKISSLCKAGRIDRGDISVIFYLDLYNREQKYYYLNEKATLQIVMGFSGKKAEILHEKIAVEFIAMKAELKEWKTHRQLASSSTTTCNDALFSLQAELKNVLPQTSKRISMIYIHFQNAINKAATGSSKVSRNALTSSQLEVIDKLEHEVKLFIENGLENSLDPIEIRVSVLAAIKAKSLMGRLQEAT